MTKHLGTMARPVDTYNEPSRHPPPLLLCILVVLLAVLLPFGWAHGPNAAFSMLQDACDNTWGHFWLP